MSSIFDPYLADNAVFNKGYLSDIEKSKNSLNGFLQGSKPQFLIILGSGLGGLASDPALQDRKVISYNDIDGFPQFRGVDGHVGELISATLEGKPVVMMSGRYHFYEYADLPHALAMKLITFPVRVFQALGVPNMIVSNAAGGVNKDFSVGDVMIMKSHINLMPSNPLLGPNIEELGIRFSPMTDAYDTRLSFLARKALDTAQQGTYLALTGPTYETPAEYGMVHRLGADAVGMSTVPEVIAARHGNFDIPNTTDIDYHNTNRMNILGLSVVTNLGGPEFTQSPSHEEVKEAANVAMPKVIDMVKGVVKEHSLCLRDYDISILPIGTLNDDLEEDKIETIEIFMNLDNYKANTLLPGDVAIEDGFVIFQGKKLGDDYRAVIEEAFKQDFYKRVKGTK